MLRGVWGAALRSLDLAAYESVFNGKAGRARQPAYIVRPAAADPSDAPALDWILLGEAADGPRALLHAWNIAAERGLGPERIEFRLKRIRGYGSDGLLLEEADHSWCLSDARWPIHPSSPCRLRFDTPLRLIRHGNLIYTPTLADLTVAAQRRLRPFMTEPAKSNFDKMGPTLLALAHAIPSLPWRGERHDLRRYSGSQKRELELRGVSGAIELPEGPGVLAPLLAAAQWTHIGKSTTVGLGQFVVDQVGG